MPCNTHHYLAFHNKSVARSASVSGLQQRFQVPNIYHSSAEESPRFIPRKLPSEEVCVCMSIFLLHRTEIQVAFLQTACSIPRVFLGQVI